MTYNPNQPRVPAGSDTGDQLIIIARNMMEGKPPVIKGKEADKWREEFQEDMDEAEELGLIIEFPRFN